MTFNSVDVGRRLREVRDAAGVSQDAAADAIGVSQATYSRLESGERVLRGDELVVLADTFGVRAAAIVGAVAVREQARFAARTDGSASPMAAMREKLYAYLELDSYLAGQGIARA
jgi:transcriptional regulator with XRE-family HTH domain